MNARCPSGAAGCVRTVFLAALLVMAPPKVNAQPAVFDPDARLDVTACDRAAAYRNDRDRLAPGVARAAIDVPEAIEQCQRDLEAWPGDPRIHYQLGRLYGYSGDQELALFHRRRAAEAGYPSAIYVLAYLDLLAADNQKERCGAGERMRLAADRGGYAAQVAFSAYLIEGRFSGCPNLPGPSAIRGYLAAARPSADGYFEILLIEHLLVEANAVGESR